MWYSQKWQVCRLLQKTIFIRNRHLHVMSIFSRHTDLNVLGMKLFMRLTSLFNFLTQILDTFCVPSIVQGAHIIPIQICTGITADFAMIFLILGRKWDLLQDGIPRNYKLPMRNS